MNEPQPISPQRRLQELMSIPERQRTDAEWDEINELEITLASVNRTENRDPGARRNAPVSNHPPKSGGGGGGGAQGKKPARKFHKRPPKGPAP